MGWQADLIVVNHFSNFVSMLLSNGNGTFQNQQTFAWPRTWTRCGGRCERNAKPTW